MGQAVHLLTRFTRRYYRLLLMLAVSVLLHALLFLPKQSNIPSTVAQHKVIHAQLQAQQPKYSQLQKEVQQETQVQPNQPAAQTQTQPPAQLKPQPITKQAVKQTTKPATKPVKPVIKPSAPAQVKTTEQPGLAIKQDELAIDPIERSYEQKLLAHLRSKLSAPEQLNGQVRLAIKFSYRQIATEVQVITSSGNASVDDWAVKSVLAANPFPSMPKELTDNYVFRPTLKIAP